MHLFTYGTLMYPAVWQQVVRRQHPSQAGMLAGFRRFAVRGEVYPVIRPDFSARVAGRVYRGLTEADLARLDTFEGEYYQRQSVPVALTQGGEVRAQVYVLRPRYYRIAAHEDWDQADFERRGIQRFLSR